MNNERLYQQIMDAYQEMGSISAVQKRLRVSEVKIRRVLITEGLWSSKTSRQIEALADKGMSLQEIAETLNTTQKAVEAYMPYRRGSYEDGAQSAAASRSETYRKRMKSAAENQVFHVKPMIDPERLYGEVMEKRPNIMRLRLELAVDGQEELSTLRAYGKAKAGIIREALVPADMTLHALHYVIQRAFGWQNSHLHHFEYPQSVQNALLRSVTASDKYDILYSDWEKLCGLYYRFPGYDNEEMYWDDDYEPYESVKTWLRKKYSGPYHYEGFSEHYLECKNSAMFYRNKNPKIRIPLTFKEYQASHMNGQEDRERIKPLESVTCDEVSRCFDAGMNELLERLPLIDLIYPETIELPDSWIHRVPERCREAVGASRKTSNTLHKLQRAIICAADLYQQDEQSGWRVYEQAFDEYKRFVSQFDAKPIPVSDTLTYFYDYGDGWRVDITCEEVYYTKDVFDYPDENGFVIVPATKEHYLESTEGYDQQNKPVSNEVRKQIAQVVTTYRPLCIFADGLNVMDDVGGISGFCHFLVSIHEGSQDEKEEQLAWARGQGWTGRKMLPERML